MPAFPLPAGKTDHSHPGIRNDGADALAFRVRESDGVPVKRTSHIAAAVVLGAVLVGGTAACSSGDSARPDGVGVMEKLPTDTDAARSKKTAGEFRNWVREHGTAQQKATAPLVRRILGEWNERKGDAYISTDIGGGTSSTPDPRAAAAAIVKAFAGWKHSGQGHASVYDVYGNAVITDYRF